MVSCKKEIVKAEKERNTIPEKEARASATWITDALV